MTQQDSSTGFFKVIIKSRTYSNILYLLLSFPLGIIYFVFIVTGISLGAGMIITVFGIFILVGVFIALYWLLVFEQKLITIFFKEDLIPLKMKESEQGIWKKIKSILTDSVLWKGSLYLIIKFILGIFSFIVTISLLSTSLSLLATPIFLFISRGFVFDSYINPWFLNYPILIPAAMVIGAFLLFISLHIINGIAWLNLKLAQTMIKRN